MSKELTDWERAGVSKEEYEEAMRGFNEAFPNLPPTDKEMDDMFREYIEDEKSRMHFDEMPRFYEKNGLEWTDDDNELFNLKLNTEFAELVNREMTVDAQANYLEYVADTIEQIREQKGLKGDEPDIPWYEAKELYFGKSPVEILQEGEDAKAEVKDAWNNLYERIIPVENFVSKQTMGALGTTYQEFKAEKQANGVKNFEIAEMKFVGPDFSKEIKGGAEPLKKAEKFMEKETGVERHRIVQKENVKASFERRLPKDGLRMLNSVENGVSNPDFDFDEYDD